MKTVIIDYGSGNLRSAARAFERAAREAGGHQQVEVTFDARTVLTADRVVLPGVGAFGDCLAGLKSVPGMVEALTETVRQRLRPFFGICVGMQLLVTEGREYGTFPGLDWISGKVVPLRPAAPQLKVPHMGWNNLLLPSSPHPLLAELPPDPHVYFVHSYHFECDNETDVAARVDYGGPCVAAVVRDNIFGCQFHPEKSQDIGIKVISAFLNWNP